MESDEEINRKKLLIRKNVKEFQDFLDGEMIFDIFTNPKAVEEEMINNKKNMLQRRADSSKSLL